MITKAAPAVLTELRYVAALLPSCELDLWQRLCQTASKDVLLLFLQQRLPQLDIAALDAIPTLPGTIVPEPDSCVYVTTRPATAEASTPKRRPCPVGAPPDWFRWLQTSVGLLKYWDCPA